MRLPPDVTLRDARPEELESVGALTEAAYEEYLAQDEISEERRAALADYRRDIRTGTPERVERGAIVIVAERDGRLIGAVTYYAPGVDKGEEGWPADFAAMRLLAVVPSERGRGIGRALTEETLRRAGEAGASRFGLHTTDMMAIARGMYERRGFVRVPELDFSPAPDILVTGYELTLSSD